jgi:uncharacterized membrane protein
MATHEEARGTLNSKAPGLILMWCASLFFILGAYWYMPFAYSGNEWWVYLLPLYYGSFLGVPGFAGIRLSLRRPRTAVLLSLAAFVLISPLMIMEIIYGDSPVRLFYSVWAAIAVYVLGAVLLLPSRKNDC